MDMKLSLLVLSVFLTFTLGKEIKVSLFPAFPSQRVYVGDEVTLRCKDGSTVLKNGVTWSYNGTKNSTNATVHLPVVTTSDSGEYQCENGQESNKVQITVLDMLPPASLSVLNQANTVVSKGDAVLLKLYHHDGLDDWRCRYANANGEWWVPIKPHPGDPKSNINTTATIHADVEDGRTYWCMSTSKTDRQQRPRSNAIKLIATEKMVRLQMSERPALKGDDVMVTCDVWGGPQIVSVVFYQNGKTKEPDNPHGNTLTIPNINELGAGQYSCSASYKFTHISKEAATHSNLSSDTQVLSVIAGLPKPKLDCETKTCVAQRTTFVWHYIPDGQTEPQILHEGTGKTITITKKGKYTCSVKMGEFGYSRRSNECLFHEPVPPVPVVVVVVLLLIVLGVIFLLLFIWKRRSNASGKKKRNIEDGADGGYEEVGKKEDGNEYERLEMSKKDKEQSQYETLKGQGKGKGEGKGEGEGEYEPLKAGEAEGSVYHTLKEKGQAEAQGQGEYEALKGTQAEVYHTLKDPGQAPAQGQGEYEALKSTQAEVYHTLKDPAQAPAQAPASGQGEYEALKTTQAEVYQTLGQGAGAGAEPAEGQGAKEESPYEELKKEKDPQ
ncbi:hypothetical protein AMEX_G9218 [Astyanax mexicanus]|uniref:Ig-like domain-containing protein n=1 Tax=Astyanax mexicanus TaxID=7994 RepID=A0A8T2M0W8_ASTMX|nr:hypothetical protein AMEX_G9218 [Astyanax mexicanus]